MSVGEGITVAGILGLAVTVPAALLSDTAITALAGVATSFIVTAGGIVIALINRPPRPDVDDNDEPPVTPRRRRRRQEVSRDDA